MPHSIERNEANLITVGASILSFTKSLGVFHYNKLVFLFEYFFIKNFGRRFTKELFVKLPHGPVIKNYKKHLKDLHESEIIQVDVKLLMQNRSLIDDFNQRIEIRVGKKAEEFMFAGTFLASFVQSLCKRFAWLSVERLEANVYETEPMRKYSISRFKKPSGGYILTSDMIKISDHRTPTTEGRRIALEHLRDYPIIDYDQQKSLTAEFSALNSFRPGA